MLPTIPSGNVASALPTGYNVDNSCRFNNDSSDNLSRTPSSSSNRRTFTFSTWFKLSGTDGALISAGTDISNGPLFIIDILSGGNEGMLRVEDSISGDNVIGLRTTRLLRDVSAWMHLCVAIDTTQGTASDRVKVYINGTQETSFGTETYCNQNLELSMNQNHITRIGTRATSPSGKYFDGYMCETVLVDGSALAPTEFGEFDSDSPTIWKPKDVSGLTFGTNGFYLDFKDSSALGNDVSGNNNDFTANNLTAVDQATDTPTNNFATLNPLNAVGTGNNPTYSEGNCKAVSSTDEYFGGSGSIGVASGKWYFEVKLTAESSSGQGVIAVSTNVGEEARQNRHIGQLTTGPSVGYYGSNGNKVVDGGSDASYGDSYAAGDIVGIALNCDDNEVVFYKNGTAQASGTAISMTSSSEFWFLSLGDAGSTTYATYEVNFGNPSYTISSGNADANGYGAFEYAPPSGYLAINSANLGSDGG